jgi:diacylglycerol kinase
MKQFLLGFVHAFRGIFLLIKTERNFQVHCLALIIVVVAGIYFALDLRDFAVIFCVSALVFATEALNTAIEKLCDEVSEERKESIRNIKDIAAGAVLICAIFAVVVAVMIFWKYVF